MENKVPHVPIILCRDIYELVRMRIEWREPQDTAYDGVENEVNENVESEHTPVGMEAEQRTCAEPKGRNVSEVLVM